MLPKLVQGYGLILPDFLALGYLAQYLDQPIEKGFRHIQQTLNILMFRDMFLSGLILIEVSIRVWLSEIASTGAAKFTQQISIEW